MITFCLKISFFGLNALNGKKRFYKESFKMSTQYIANVYNPQFWLTDIKLLLREKATLPNNNLIDLSKN